MGEMAPQPTQGYLLSLLNLKISPENYLQGLIVALTHAE